MPVAEIENADVILIVGSQLRFEVPLLHQRVRKAWKRGATVHVVNPVDFDFAFDIAGKQIVSPSRIADALGSAQLADPSTAATPPAATSAPTPDHGTPPFAPPQTTK